jgi:hypothetical protein
MEEEDKSGHQAGERSGTLEAVGAAMEEARAATEEAGVARVEVAGKVCTKHNLEPVNLRLRTRSRKEATSRVLATRLGRGAACRRRPKRRAVGGQSHACTRRQPVRLTRREDLVRLVRKIRERREG